MGAGTGLKQVERAPTMLARGNTFRLAVLPSVNAGVSSTNR
ncbi:protein of unassigned function [Methylobacterium oryzae CBMB20]|uniref:Protein of unassigned function n=1 Tax=Methylobacterium oryzae CBMB20 TaxID=693986 RepID=A0A089NQ61_9HYPH|nr:protein of unassigned function [Methylobacterium oryzae CBMB20]